MDEWVEEEREGWRGRVTGIQGQWRRREKKFKGKWQIGYIIDAQEY